MADKTIAVIFRLNDRISQGLQRIRAQFDGLRSATGRVTEGTRRTTAETERLIRKAAGLRQLKSGYDTAAASAARLGGILKSIAVRGGVITLAGATAAVYGVKQLATAVIATSSSFEMLEARMASAFKGNRALVQQTLADIVTLARDTPFEIEGLTQAFLTLKNFGLEPAAGSLKAAIEQAAALGGKVETLDAITRELGQAWARGKLQGDGIRTLIQNGVPIIELLAKATGQSADQIDRMSEKGQLNRAVMQRLFAVMAQENAGASARAMQTYTGQISNFADTWTMMKKAVGDAGFFADIKTRLAALNQWFAAFYASASGRETAQRISNVLVEINRALAGMAIGAFDWLRSLDPARVREVAEGVRIWAYYFLRLAQFYGPRIAAFAATVLPVFIDRLAQLGSALSRLPAWAKDLSLWLAVIALTPLAGLVSALSGMGAGLVRMTAGLVTFGRAAGVFAGLPAAELAGLRTVVAGLLPTLAAVGPALAGPWGLAVAAVVAAGYEIYTHWDELTAACTAMWKQFGEAVGLVWNNLKTAVKPVTDWISRQFEIATNYWVELFSSTFDKLREQLQSLGADFKNWWQGTGAGGAPVFNYGNGPVGQKSPTAAPAKAIADTSAAIAAPAQALGLQAVDTALLAAIAGRESASGRNAGFNTTDINARRGTPSFGPFQFIEPTFRRRYQQAMLNPVTPEFRDYLQNLGPMNWQNPKQQAAIAAYSRKVDRLHGNDRMMDDWATLKAAKRDVGLGANRVTVDNTIRIEDHRTLSKTVTSPNATGKTKVGVSKFGKERP